MHSYFCTVSSWSSSCCSIFFIWTNFCCLLGDFMSMEQPRWHYCFDGCLTILTFDDTSSAFCGWYICGNTMAVYLSFLLLAMKLMVIPLIKRTGRVKSKMIILKSSSVATWGPLLWRIWSGRSLKGHLFQFGCTTCLGQLKIPCLHLMLRFALSLPTHNICIYLYEVHWRLKGEKWLYTLYCYIGMVHFGPIRESPLSFTKSTHWISAYPCDR